VGLAIIDCCLARSWLTLAIMSLTLATQALRRTLTSSRSFPLVLLAAASVNACGSSSSNTPPGPSANLILNPGAEAGMGTDGTSVATSIPDWTTTGEANVVQYGSSSFPATTDPGPPDEGMNFFTGGPDDAVSTFTQDIDLSAYASDIAKGSETFTLSAYLGGYSDQDDDATLTVYFLDAANVVVVGAAGDGGEDAGEDGGEDGGEDAGIVLPAGVLGSASIGPVTSADRSSATGLLPVSATGTIPVGTMAIELQLVMIRYDGAYNDGYADDLSFTVAN